MDGVVHSLLYLFWIDTGFDLRLPSVQLRHSGAVRLECASGARQVLSRLRAEERRGQSLLRGDVVGDSMQPLVPFRRHLGGIEVPLVVNHPSIPAVYVIPVLIILVAEVVCADQGTELRLVQRQHFLECLLQSLGLDALELLHQHRVKPPSHHHRSYNHYQYICSYLPFNTNYNQHLVLNTTIKSGVYRF